MKGLFKLNWNFYLGVILTTLGGVIFMLLPYQIKFLIDSKTFKLETIFVFILIFLSQMIVTFVGSYLKNSFAGKEISNLRVSLIRKLVYAQKQFFNSTKKGELLSNIINDTEKLENYLIIKIPKMISGIFSILIAVFLMVRLDYKLTLIILLTIPFLFITILPISGISSNFSKKSQESVAKANSSIGETLTRIDLLKSYNTQEYEIKRNRDFIEKIRKYNLKSEVVNGVIDPILELVFFSTIGFVMFYGASRINHGTLTVGVLISFVMYLIMFLNPTSNLLSFINDYKTINKQMEKVLEINTLAKKENNGYISVNADLIKFVDVDFSYCEGVSVLKRLNLSFLRGNKTALIGPSGSGKTTVTNLIERFYNVSGGEVLFGNTNIKDIDLYSWREKICYVGQENSIISGSIRDNITYGIDRSCSDEEIYQALENVNLKKEVLNLNETLDSDVGEVGSKLSGGQKQRLQLARIYLKKADIIILDEVTSNLDADSEYQVSKCIENLDDKIVIIIAHRLSTIQNCDMIYFLDEGVNTGSGTHLELYKNNEKYKRFVKEQLLKTN